MADINKAARKVANAADLTEAIRKGLVDSAEDPQLAEFAAYFTHLAGGPRGLAKMAFDAYQHEGTSQMMRHRILESVLRATKFANEQSGPRSDLGLASDDDLIRELHTVVTKIQGNSGG